MLGDPLSRHDLAVFWPLDKSPCVVLHQCIIFLHERLFPSLRTSGVVDRFLVRCRLRFVIRIRVCEKGTGFFAIAWRVLTFPFTRGNSRGRRRSWPLLWSRLCWWREIADFVVFVGGLRWAWWRTWSWRWCSRSNSCWRGWILIGGSWEDMDFVENNRFCCWYFRR